MVRKGVPFLRGLVLKKNESLHMCRQLSLARNRKGPGIGKGIDVPARANRLSQDGCLHNDLALTTTCMCKLC